LKAGVWLRRERFTMTAPFHGSFRPAVGEVITQRGVQLTGATSLLPERASRSAYAGVRKAATQPRDRYRQSFSAVKAEIYRNLSFHRLKNPIATAIDSSYFAESSVRAVANAASEGLGEPVTAEARARTSRAMPAGSCSLIVSNMGSGWSEKYVMIALRRRRWFCGCGSVRPWRAILIVPG
jgi:hypothetical protein